MFNYFKSLLDMFNIYASKNQMVAGALSLWGLGVISYLCKDIPRKIWGLVKKYSTTTVTISSHHDIFYLFLKWDEKNGFSTKGRYIKIHNGKWGEGGIIQSLGYGEHYFWFQNHFFVLSMSKEEGTITDKDKDTISMVMFGRNYTILQNMFKEVLDCEERSKDRELYIKKFNDDWWNISSNQRPRSFDTIYIRQDTKEKLLTEIDNFLLREEWYLKNGIPYQMGILLYGPPGTGKTSIIQAISSYMGYPLHILSASSLTNIERAMFKLPEKSLIIIEDIDTNSALQKRYMSIKNVNNKSNSLGKTCECIGEDDVDECPNIPSSTNIINFSFSNLSDILNTIDGVQTHHGRVLIMTTNYIDNLDSALLRPGRIDLKIKIDYADREIVTQFFDRFYPNFRIPINFEVADNISSATIQNYILENLNNPEKVLKAIQYKG